MHSQLTIPLLLVLGICGLFTAVIIFGLSARKIFMAHTMTIRANDVRASLAGSECDTSSLLYGVRQDFSSTEAGMIVRDVRDQQVGRIISRVAARRGWLRLETGDAVFEADVLSSVSQSVALHRVGNEASTLCTFRRDRLGTPNFGTYNFDVPGLGVLTSTPPKGLRLAPRFEYTLDGKPIGIAQHIGGAIDRGWLLNLPATIPLPVRLFILAMQMQRF